MKLLIFLAALAFITYTFISKWDDVKVSLNEFDWFVLLPVVLLMFINWALESIKWRTVVRPLESISFNESIKGVLSGLSIGIFTPNRIGNFIGRVYFLKPENRLKASLLTMYANFSQFMATLVFGVIGLLLFTLVHGHGKFEGVNTPIILMIAMLFIFTSIVIYVKPEFFGGIIHKLFKNKKVGEVMDVLPLISNPTRLKVISLSFSRYIIFTIQFTWLIFSQDGSISFYELWIGVSVVYLITAIIPSPFLGKIGIRESVAIVVFSMLHVMEPQILVASFLLWMINLVAPSLFGGLILLISKYRTK